MTGTLAFTAPGEPAMTHDRVVFEMGADLDLCYRDIRRFGRLERLLPTVVGLRRLDGADPLGALGPDALALDGATFADRLLTRPHLSIKAALLDQGTIAGVGNIYADESLWAARIWPERRIETLTEPEIAHLWARLWEILRVAIEQRGSRIDSFVPPGAPAQMAARLQVYGRAGAPCPRCGTLFSALRVAGRGTSACRVCQT